MKKTIISAVLCAYLAIGAVMISGCITCAQNIDRATCDVQNAEAIAGLVDNAAGAALAVLGPLATPVVLAAYATFHAALPLAITALNAALAEYESAHTGAWAVLLSGLESLYQSFDKLWTTVTGQASLVTAAKAQVKARGASQVLSMLKTEKGKAELLKGVLK